MTEFVDKPVPRPQLEVVEREVPKSVVLKDRRELQLMARGRILRVWPRENGSICPLTSSNFKKFSRS